LNYVQGKVVVITGAGSGFGKLTSEKLANMGGKIILADINEETVKATTDNMKSKDGIAEYIVTDVSAKEQVDRMTLFALTTFGRIDILINNAGIMPTSLFASKQVEAWDKCININLKGPIYAIASVIDTMYKQGEGHIINVSSLYATKTHAGAGVYCATKAGLKMISDALRAETRGKIKVSTVYPSAAATNLSSTILDFEAVSEFYGKYWPEFNEAMSNNPDLVLNPDMNDPKVMLLSAEAIADTIVFCVNQPKGITISDIIVRATNEPMII
jgi:NADP-dependent 3-hydroxy acid dehydrogenase YdfG